MYRNRKRLRLDHAVDAVVAFRRSLPSKRPLNAVQSSIRTSARTAVHAYARITENRVYGTPLLNQEPRRFLRARFLSVALQANEKARATSGRKQ
jgi:hypothetical protein